MAKYLLTFVFLGLLTILFYYPTPGDIWEQELQYDQEKIVPKEKTIKKVLAAEPYMTKDSTLANAIRYDESLTLK